MMSRLHVTWSMLNTVLDVGTAAFCVSDLDVAIYP